MARIGPIAQRFFVWAEGMQTKTCSLFFAEPFKLKVPVRIAKRFAPIIALSSG